MYERFYKLREKPFNMTPDPEFLFFTEKHREAFAHLVYGIRERRGFIEVTGEVGAGKTTICRALLNEFDADTKIALILNPFLSDLELLRAINEELYIDASGATKKELLDTLNRYLIDQHAAGRNVVLLIDEAQNLPPETLEQIRIISNLETVKAKLIQIVLVGQPELRDKLARPELRQLNQRITVRYHISPLSRQETEDYIYHRLKVAGDPGEIIFTEKAVDCIHKYSGGIPRMINILCDHALLSGFVNEQYEIDLDLVRKARREIEGQQFGRPALGQRRLVRPLLVAGLAAVLVLIALAFFAGRGRLELPSPLERLLAGNPGEAGEFGSYAEFEAAALTPVLSASQKGDGWLELPLPGATESAAIEGRVGVQPDSSGYTQPDSSRYGPSGLLEESGASLSAGGSGRVQSTEGVPEESGRMRKAADLLEESGGASSAGQSGGAQSAGGVPEESGGAKRTASAGASAGSDVSSAVSGQSAAEAAEAAEPGKFDADGVLRCSALDETRPAALITLARLWVPDGERLEELYATCPAEAGADWATSVFEPFGLAPVSWSTNLAMLRAINLPAVAETYEAALFTPRYLTVIGLEGEDVVVADPRSGLRRLNAQAFNQQWFGHLTILVPKNVEPEEILGHRSMGQEVRSLQFRLKKLGFFEAEPSGVYDAYTIERVKDFQRQNRIKIDGLVGLETNLVLFSQLAGVDAPRLLALHAKSN